MIKRLKNALSDVLGLAITVAVVSVKRRGIQGAATLAFGWWLGACMWMFVPGSY